MNLFRKTTATVALVALVSGIFSTGVSAYSTAEVEAANMLAARGIINNHTANPAGYNLDQNVLRQEIAAVARGVAGLDRKTTCDNVYSDVSATTPNDWACYSVEALADAGLIALNPTFRPEDNITKAEAVGMMVKAAFDDEYMYDSSLSTSWQEQVVAFAVMNGVVSSFTNYDTPATRGFVFEAGANAILAIEEEEDDILSDLLEGLLGGGSNDEDETTDETTDETGTPIVVTGGNVEVSLNPASANSQTIPQTGLVTFGKFDVTAGSQDVSVDTLTLKREGLSNRSDIRRVYFEKNGMRISTRANVATDDTVLVSFNPALVVKAGSTETIDLVVELSSTAQVGAEHAFAVISGDASATLQGLPARTNLMRIGSYTVESVTFSKVNFGDPEYNVGERDVLLGEFQLQTTGDRDNLFKSITLRNAGTSDLLGSVANLAIYNDGQKVSTNVQFSGREVTFTVSSQIENGRTENYQIRGDILSADRVDDTIEFELRNSTDIVVVEVATSFSAPILGVTSTISLAEVTVKGGDLLLSRDTSVGLNQTVSASTNDVVLLSAKFNPNEAVTLEDVRINYTTTGSGLFQQFSSLRLVVDGKTISTYTPANSAPENAVEANGSLTFDTTFTANSLVNIQVLGNVRNSAPVNATFNISTFAAADLGVSSARYVSNDESATINGSAQGVNLSIANSTLTLTRNDAIDASNNTVVSGASDVVLLGFSARANDVSDLRISAINPTLSGDVVLNQINNVRLYQGDTVIATRNNFDFNGLNITIPKNTAVNFRLVADFTNTISNGDDLTLTLNANSITARNVASNQTVTHSALVGQELSFVAGGAAVVTLNSSTAQRAIVTPSTTETSVFRFDVEAKDDNLRLTDLYISNTGSVALTSALRSSSIVVDGRTIAGVVLNDTTLYFPIGNSNPVMVSKDQTKTIDLRVSFNDSSARTNQDFRFAIAQNAQLVGLAVNGTSNGMRIVSESNGDELTLSTSSVQSNEHLLARSKPTVAMTSFTASTNDLYRFSVTADSNRKLTLTGLTMGLGGSANLTGATITVYKDSESAGNVAFTLNASGVVTSVGNAINREVAAGSTNNYIVKITGANSTAVDQIREANITQLIYVDDVTTPAAISTAVYNVGVPTQVSSYKY